MKKYENFCIALQNMKDIYKYDEPYDNVVLTGSVGLYKITFEQSWKMMKELLEEHGYSKTAGGIICRLFCIPYDILMGPFHISV